MLSWLIRRFHRHAAARPLYDLAVAAARQPGWYLDGGMPDTPLGRFQLISLHLFPLLERLRGQPALAQGVYDLCLADLDGAARELAVSEPRVGPSIQALVQRFAGRMQSFAAAADRAALADAIARNLFGGAPPAPDLAQTYADYALAARVRLAQLRDEDLAAGRADWPPIPFANPES